MSRLLPVAATLIVLLAWSPAALAQVPGGDTEYGPYQYPPGDPDPCQYGTEPPPPECQGPDGCDPCAPPDPPQYEAAPEVPASVVEGIGRDVGEPPSPDATALNEALKTANDARAGGEETAQAVEGVAPGSEAAGRETVGAERIEPANTEPGEDGTDLPEAPSKQSAASRTEAPEDTSEATGVRLAGGAEPRAPLSTSGALPFALLGAFIPVLIAAGLLLRRVTR